MNVGPVVALSGGVGGAKLAFGLYRVLPPDSLTVICNPGDDFDHLGLRICPDADTVLYTLAGLANSETGWGRGGETWTFMQALAALGGESWFRLGDGDLALHVERSRRLAAGEPLSHVTENVARRLGVRARIVPACDAAVRTTVRTPGGRLPFQHYFVRDRLRAGGHRLRLRGRRGRAPVRGGAGGARRSFVAVYRRVPVQTPSSASTRSSRCPGWPMRFRAAAAPVIGVSQSSGAAR